MNDVKIIKILVEYYETVSNVLQYEPDSENEKLSDAILKLLLAIFNSDDAEKKCREMIKSTECMQTLADIALVKNDKTKSNNIAYEIKSSVLKKTGIECVNVFDMDMFVLSTQKSALAGDRCSCKLWACMNWLGIGIPENQTTAIEIWKQLAVCGEITSVSALIYGYSCLGNTKEKIRWETVSQKLEAAYENFMPMVFPDNAEVEYLNGIELANLILAIKSRSTRDKNSAYINRAMAYYVLYDEDEFEEKLKNLSTDKDFYSLLWNGRKYKNKKFGF
ncbi:MAG: hypothetical protein ACI3XQ_10635 [Eubacteriales bacterium]